MSQVSILPDRVNEGRAHLVDGVLVQVLNHQCRGEPVDILGQAPHVSGVRVGYMCKLSAPLLCSDEENVRHTVHPSGRDNQVITESSFARPRQQLEALAVARSDGSRVETGRFLVDCNVF